jgi:hypothetical protein
MLKRRRRRDEETIMLFKERARPEPGREFWDGYWDRLQARMAAEPKPAPAPVIPKAAAETVRRRRPGGRVRGSLRGAALPAAAAALIAAGILIGRWSRGPAVPVPGQGPSVMAAELELRTGRYLDRSRNILLALVNYSPETKDPFGLNLPGQKTASRELIQEAATLRGDLIKARERRLEKLVGDLQVILLQIANLGSADDQDAVRIARAGVEGRDILFQINLAGLRASTGRPSPAPTGPGPARTY